LLAYDAKIKVASKKGGERVIPAHEFHLGYYETALEEGEMITEIQIPAPEPKTGAAFTKFTLLENYLAVAS
jgi:carbon-monoxide dehydrogenase medium subunit